MTANNPQANGNMPNHHELDGHQEDHPNHDFTIPYELFYTNLHDDEETEQHKRLRGQTLSKRSIRHYNHATTKWGSFLENFSPMWFALVISSGGLGLLFAGTFPYRAHWQIIIATIQYVLELVLFFTFGAILLLKWIIYPHVAVRKAMNDPDELGAYAIPPIALMTIGALTASQVSLGPWGGHAFTIVAYVLWWIGMIWTFLTAVVVLTTLFYTGNQSSRTMSPVLFMAPVGLATAATESGFITIYSKEMSARMAGPMLVVGYFAGGVALFMAIILYTIYFHRLLAAGFSPPAKRPGLVILIGPAGQLATAFQMMGQSAAGYNRFAEYKPTALQPPTYGTFWTAQTAQGLQGSGIFFALLILGFGYLMLFLAIVGVVDVFVKRQVKYSLTWWALVFPSVTITTAWMELASSMDSPAFRGLVCAMTVLLYVVYFINWGFTIWGIVDGSLIFGKTHLETEMELMAKAQGQRKKEDI
ncbi:unnamed protein product [Cercospora beticola]|nr:unnamed protein product [Cercospora beticola]